tara:strand:- start:294 stop:1004 length:711 start_codon:yes stop_codon:yes gene_type:complete
MNTVANFRGAVHSGDTAIDLYFQAAAAGSSGVSAYDKIPLVITSEKEQEVMESISAALTGSHSSPMVVIADDVALSYVNDNIASVGTISLNSSPRIARVEDVTANDSLLASESGTIYVFQDAAAVLTLPDSGGGDIIGTTYTFISNFAATGQEVKCADTDNEIIIGSLLVSDTDDATTAGSYTAEVGNAYSSVEFTGATEGELGSMFKLTCYDQDRWYIEGTALQGGGTATPFATS